MVISVRPTLSPTQAFLFPPLGNCVSVIWEEEEIEISRIIENRDNCFLIDNRLKNKSTAVISGARTILTSV